jgi:two-component system chemotaxis response regulator CheB
LPGHDIIVVGASAGGVEALAHLVGGLPADLPASIFVVVHVPPAGPSALPEILGRRAALAVAHAVDGEPIVPGRVYVAPPDRHLLVRRDRVELSHGPAENRLRPAVDPLFRSVAGAHGPRVVAVVLTGALDDGTSGLQSVKRRGGVAIVQDPREALYAGMPASALEYVDVDHVAPLAHIPALLTEIAATSTNDVEPIERAEKQTVAGNEAEAKMAYSDDETREGTPSVWTCPDCTGTLWEVRDGGLLRFECRVGHAYSADSMVVAQDEATERALRSLEENAALARRMADRARARKSSRVADRFDARRRGGSQRRARSEAAHAFVPRARHGDSGSEETRER